MAAALQLAALDLLLDPMQEPMVQKVDPSACPQAELSESRLESQLWLLL